jgi:hypothetical protein
MRNPYCRIPKYNEKYSRKDFEMLWSGFEHLCPYYDDPPIWPEHHCLCCKSPEEQDEVEDEDEEEEEEAEEV